MAGASESPGNGSPETERNCGIGRLGFEVLSDILLLLVVVVVMVSGLVCRVKWEIIYVHI